MMVYPIMLNLDGKQAVVIGGGEVAERKVSSLLRAKALVTVVSPSLSEGMQSLVEQENILWCKKRFEPADVAGAFIVVAATNDRKVNLAVYEAAKDKLINIVDRPDLCTFHVPAVFEQGKLTLAISTGGASPALAKTIKQKLGQVFDDSYGDYLDFLAVTRPIVLEKVSQESGRRALFRKLASEQFFTEGNWEQAFQMLLNESFEKEED